MRKKQMNLHNSKLEISCVNSTNFPDNNLPEYVLCGRSNVGKSSLINALLNRKKLAYISSTPGKTRIINFYNIDNSMRLVDLPGYGYAKTDKKERYSWANMMNDYFGNRESISGFLQLVDSRHEPQTLDITMAEYINSYIENCYSNNLPIPKWEIILTKIDKIKKSEYEEREAQAHKMLNIGNYANIVLFSAEKKLGVEELWEQILGFNTAENC